MAAPMHLSPRTEDLATNPNGHSMPTVPVHLAKAGTVREFTSIPVHVEAVQFLGWGNASTIFHWCDGVMYVPQGYDHQLRINDEFDKNAGRVRPDAAEYLSIKGADAPIRVDLGTWLVKKQNGEMHIYTNDQFAATFAESN